MSVSPFPVEADHVATTIRPSAASETLALVRAGTVNVAASARRPVIVGRVVVQIAAGDDIERRPGRPREHITELHAGRKPRPAAGAAAELAARHEAMPLVVVRRPFLRGDVGVVLWRLEE